MMVYLAMKLKDSDIDNWPSTWKIIPEDIKYGKSLINIFKLYIKDIRERNLSIKTINDHIDNLWLLGGFAIKQININPDLRKRNPAILLSRYIDFIDGPLIQDLSEYEQESFNRTCRNFYKYLVENKLKKMI